MKDSTAPGCLIMASECRLDVPWMCLIMASECRLDVPWMCHRVSVSSCSLTWDLVWNVLPSDIARCFCVQLETYSSARQLQIWENLCHLFCSCHALFARKDDWHERHSACSFFGVKVMIIWCVQVPHLFFFFMCFFLFFAAVGRHWQKGFAFRTVYCWWTPRPGMSGLTGSMQLSHTDWGSHPGTETVLELSAMCRTWVAGFFRVERSGRFRSSPPVRGPFSARGCFRLLSCIPQIILSQIVSSRVTSSRVLSPESWRNSNTFTWIVSPSFWSHKLKPARLIIRCVLFPSEVLVQILRSPAPKKWLMLLGDCAEDHGATSCRFFFFFFFWSLQAFV